MALIVAKVSLTLLTLLAIGLSLIALVTDQQKFLMTVKRVRWLLMIMLVLYAYGTPGQYLSQWFMAVRPSYEGVVLGFKQVLRIVSMLASLSLVLSTTSQQRFIGGLYQFMSLFDALKIDAKQFAVRVWLTLDYVETQEMLALKKRSFFDVFNQVNAVGGEQAHSDTKTHKAITLSVQPLTIVDKVILLVIIAASLLLVWMY